MSRRKQGKPQQHKKLVNLDAELERDILTCGACHLVFPLNNIVKFIQHKVERCCKENIDPFDTNSDGDSEEDQSNVLSVISAQKPSISAPIATRDKLLSPITTVDKLSDLPLQDDTNVRKQHNIKMEDEEGEEEMEDDDIHDENLHHVVATKPLCHNVGVNTIVTEPCNFVCHTCKSIFSSAWFLVQHVQTKHGLKIYLEDQYMRQPTPGEEGKNGPILPPLSKPVKEEKEVPKKHCQSPSPVPHKPSPRLHEAFVPPQPPFMFRMPLERQPISSAVGPGPFPRPTHDFRLECYDPFRSMPPGHMQSFDHSLPPTYNNPFDHRVSKPPHTSVEDFYSKRLRLLAHGTPSSPSGSPSPGQQQQQPHNSILVQPSQQPSTTYSPPASQAPPPPSSSVSSTDSGGVQTPRSGQQEPLQSEKLKSCEFCGKCFKFSSNLTVHRRTHTQEKPYRCRLCSHCSSQATKLKRHMKVHNKSAFMPVTSTAGSETGERSANSTPDSSQQSKQDEDTYDDKDSDLDQLIEDDDEETAIEEEAASAEYSKVTGENWGAPIPFNMSESDSSMDENDEHIKDEPEVSQDSEGSNRDANSRQSSSLLSEVMENSGLGNIQPYNEAFKQALEENRYRDHNSDDKAERNSSSDSAKNGVKEEPSSTDSSRPGSSHQPYLDSKMEHPNKKLKLDSSDLPSKMFHRNDFYPNIWFPPTAPIPPFMSHPDRGLIHRSPVLPHNGIGPMNHDSAFKLSTESKPGTNLGPLNTSPSSQSPGVPINRNSNKRNDTCEFCGKIFKNCSNLTVHRRSHTGEKPYKCHLCSYACAQSSKLTRHMKTHGRVGKDVYRCKFCNMPFSVPSTLEKHMRKCVENQQNQQLLNAEKAAPGAPPNSSIPSV